MLDELEGVGDSFSFNLGLGGSSSDGVADSSHGGGLFVREAFVGHLNPVGVVIDTLFRLLGQVGEVGAGCLGGVFWLISFKKFCLDGVPVVGGDSIFSKAFKPSNGLIPETHLELQKLAIIIPVGDGTGVVNPNDKKSSSNGILTNLTIVKRYIH